MRRRTLLGSQAGLHLHPIGMTPAHATPRCDGDPGECSLFRWPRAQLKIPSLFIAEKWESRRCYCPQPSVQGANSAENPSPASKGLNAKTHVRDRNRCVCGPGDTGQGVPRRGCWEHQSV